MIILAHREALSELDDSRAIDRNRIRSRVVGVTTVKLVRLLKNH